MNGSGYFSGGLCMYQKINRICHWSPMQIEKSQTEGKRIMLEMRFTKFLALSVDPRVGISRSAIGD